MSPPRTAFDRTLREIAVPALQAHGFRFDGGRTFRRPSGASCLVIHFQLGERSMEGKFAVNLGAFAQGDSPGVDPAQARHYHCRSQRQIRLGELLPPRFPRLARLPRVGFLFGPRDHWWSFSEEPAHTRASVATAVDVLVDRGLPWFERVAP